MGGKYSSDAVQSVAEQPVLPGLDLDVLFDRISKVKKAKDDLVKQNQDFNIHVSDLDLQARTHGIGSVAGNPKTGQVTLTPGGVPLTPELAQKQRELELMDQFFKNQFGGQSGSGVSSSGVTPSSPSSAPQPAGPPSAPTAPQAGQPTQGGGNPGRLGPAVKSASFGPFQVDFDTPQAVMERAGNLRKEMLQSPIIKVQSETGPLVTAAEDVLGRIEKGSIKDFQAADQTLIIALNKVLDPSVVRESEFDRSTQGQSLRSKLIGYLDQLSTGGQGLTLQARKEIVKQIKILSDARGGAYNQVLDTYESLADQYTVPRSMITTGLQRYEQKAKAEESNDKPEKKKTKISYIKEIK